MGLSLRSIGHALGTVAKAVNPVSHALYGAIGGKSPTQLAKDYVTGAGRAAAGAGVLGAGYLAAPAVGSALGGGAAAGGAAGTAGTAGGMTAGLSGGGLGLLGSIGSGLLKAAPLIL